MMSSVMPSTKNSCSGSPLKLANGKTADRRAEVFRLTGALTSHPVDADRSADVLELLRAEILEIVPDSVRDLIVDDSGHIDGTRLGKGLDPCRDVDTVAENIAGLDDNVAGIDPDPHSEAPLGR